MSVKVKTQKNIPQVPLKELETLWLQVGGTLCNLECTHCFISCGPKNYTIPMMTLAQVKERLRESDKLGVKDYYITGGEVFINPEIFEILEAILFYGPLDVLTNGTQITSDKAKRLREIQNTSKNPLRFRISMEHFEESKNDQIRADKIGIIYQQNNLLPDFNALENVYLARLAIDNDKNKAILDAKKIVRSFGLSNRLSHFPSELSGGELQRIAISRALINKPEIILADEPTGSLDYLTAKEVFKSLYKLKNKSRLIIYATHNRLFADMADCKLEIIDGIMKPSNGRK